MQKSVFSAEENLDNLVNNIKIWFWTKYVEKLFQQVILSMYRG